MLTVAKILSAIATRAANMHMERRQPLCFPPLTQQIALVSRGTKCHAQKGHQIPDHQTGNPKQIFGLATLFIILVQNSGTVKMDQDGNLPVK